MAFVFANSVPVHRIRVLKTDLHRLQPTDVQPSRTCLAARTWCALVTDRLAAPGGGQAAGDRCTALICYLRRGAAGAVTRTGVSYSTAAAPLRWRNARLATRSLLLYSFSMNSQRWRILVNSTGGLPLCMTLHLPLTHQRLTVNKTR